MSHFFIARLFVTFIVSVSAVAVPASAKWRMAESDHFVIYAEDSEKDLTRFADMLERYHAAMSFVTGRNPERPSPSNRVTIYVVGDQGDIRRLAGSDNRYIAGFYTPRAAGSVAFVQDIRPTSGEPTFSMTVLLHEYAHHYIISSSRYGMPRWLGEGAAEFFASAKFPSDGSVQIGRPANHRAGELSFADDVSVHELLDPELYEAKRGKGYDAFYGKAWLLYHYLTFDDERDGQLVGYMRALMAGKSSPEAAREVFGDIDTLDREVKAYLRARRMTAFNLTPDKITIGAVRVSELGAGAEAMMPVVLQSRRGVDSEQAAVVVEQARAVAAKFPDDAFVQTALAEAEFDAGNDAEAIAAADRALAIDSGSKNALVQKGYALFRMAEDAADPEQAYKKAMAPFSRLNQLERDHPLPLVYLYRSFAQRGIEPTEQAKHALERAAELAPFDKALWMNVGLMQAQEGQIALARFSLEPIANDPHGGSAAQAAKAMIAVLEKAPEGVPLNISAARRAANSAAGSAPDEDGPSAEPAD